MWQRSDGVVAIYEEGRSPAGLYIHLFGPKEDVVSAEPGIRSGRSACLNQLIITSGYIYGPKKRQSLNLHFHKGGFSCSFGVVRRDITAAVISKEVGSSVAPPVEALPPLQTFPWQEQFINSTVCSDKCVGHAKDGVCDDGRDGRGQVSTRPVDCSAGRDGAGFSWGHRPRDQNEEWIPSASLSTRCMTSESCLHPCAGIL